MDLVTIIRQNTPDGKVWLTLRTDTILSNPFVTVEWITEAGTESANLVVTSVSQEVVTGYLQAEIEGTLKISGNLGSVTLIDGEQKVSTPPTKVPDKPTETAEFIDHEYKDAITVTYEWNFESSAYSSVYAFVNRLADSGGSGVVLLETIAEGWALPGILKPLSLDEERLAELLAKPYDPKSEAGLNQCYLLGDDIVFVRGSASGNFVSRIPASSVYTFEVRGSIAESFTSDMPLLEQSAFPGLQRVEEDVWSNASSIDSIQVQSSAWQTSIDKVFEDSFGSVLIRPAAYFRPFAPPRTQNRLQDQAFSTTRDIHVDILGE